MNIYFSPVPDEFLDHGPYPTCTHGNAFYYILSVEPDQVVITDSCGRYIPLEREALADLHAAIEQALDVYEQADAMQRQYDEAEAILAHIYG